MAEYQISGERTMKYPRLFLSLALVSLSAATYAQSAKPQPAPPSEAQQAFDQLKTLSGTWQAHITVTPPMKEMSGDKPTQVTMRVTSRGNALVHEMQEEGTPLDPKLYDHPVTMLYLDGGSLILTHYCDAGNRPRMAARTSPDGKTVEFDLLDVAGSTHYGHMQHAVFTLIDANHHTEDWTYMMPGDKPIHAHFDLQRANTTTASK